MRILVISDSHGNQEAVDNIIRLVPNVNLYIHAGDGECHAQEIYPFKMVRGNCDYAYDLNDELIIPSSFGNILVRHKPEVTASFLRKHDIKLFIFGHTHQRACYEKYNVAFLNPGAVTYARDSGNSYAILEEQDRDILATFYSLETNKVIEQYRIYYKGDTKEKTTCTKNITK